MMRRARLQTRLTWTSSRHMRDSLHRTALCEARKARQRPGAQFRLKESQLPAVRQEMPLFAFAVYLGLNLLEFGTLFGQTRFFAVSADSRAVSPCPAGAGATGVAAGVYGSQALSTCPWSIWPLAMEPAAAVTCSAAVDSAP